MQTTKIYNSYFEKFKSPFGAVKVGEEVRISICLEETLPVKQVQFLLFSRKKPERLVLEKEMEKTQETGFYTIYFKVQEAGSYFYYFKVIDTADKIYFVKRDFYSNDAILNEHGYPYYLVAHNYAKKEMPQWIYGGIMYQIFPDRFCSSHQYLRFLPNRKIKMWDDLPDYLPNEKGKILNHDFFGGDLPGITKKLDYLASLSVTCIYLNPICLASENHRYNTADFMKIDPLLGKEEDLKELCQKAKKKGIRIILDAVFSHVGADSVYFNKYKNFGIGGAYQDPTSPYYPWFHFYDYPEKYEAWWGHESLPAVRKDNMQYQNYICQVIEHYMNLGVSGFRLDVADELPNSFLQMIHKKVKAMDPQAVIIGEVWEDAITKESYGEQKNYLLGDKVDSVMNYFIRNPLMQYILQDEDESGKIRGEFYNTLMWMVEQYPKPALNSMMNFLSTHDVERAITALGGERYYETGNLKQDRNWQMKHDKLTPEQYELGKKRLKIASMILYFLPGIPCIYYGDEVGMTGYKDPFNRKTFPWNNQDKNILMFYRVLGTIRELYPIFRYGSFRIVTIDNRLFVATRTQGKQQMILAINRSNQTIDIKKWIPQSARMLLNTRGSHAGVLKPYGGVWLKATKS